METLIVEKVNQNNKYYKMDCRISQREKSENDWINDQGSGCKGIRIQCSFW